jgi:uncharacterized protein (DUF1919 family)
MADLNLWEKAMGWRKRQMVEAQIDDVYVSPSQRNKVLEEVAKEFDKMPFGDTAASFATYVRNMKNNAKT